jgi:multidrug efflux pump subunit AcrB
MNIAELSIKKKVITMTLTVLLVVVGIKAFDSLARLEDPEFTIKDAIIVTPYPGASAAEVEQEVTNVIELACQQLGQLKRVESTSRRGFSQVKAKIKDKYDKASLPQVWDELRRKVTDAQAKLPPGAGPSIVNDDFGDVYGIYLALTGEGYTYRDLYEFAKVLRRELLLVQDVKKIILWGNQPEVVWVEMSRSKMAALGISQDDIYAALSAKNLPADGGRIELGPDLIPINPSGEFRSEQEFGDLMISARGSDRLVYLRDVATVRRGYVDPPTQILKHNDKPAIGIGISTVMGGNVVTMGEAIEAKLAQLAPQTPLGMELEVISLQSKSVTEAINGFVINLLEAVVIVVVVLLIFMGLRSGLIIGFVLFLTICGTFIFMKTEGVMLERISLGALIIALGMLVDNAIVVIDGMKVRIEAGEDRIKAASAVVGQQAVPLLGATAVAVAAFAAIGTSQDSTGEYCRSLFTVILISLFLSWATAVTSTPLIGKIFLAGPKNGKGAGKEAQKKDPYGGVVFRAYKNGLVAAIRHRRITVLVIIGMFVASLYGFGFVKQMFFPNSTRPQFFIDFFFPEGTHMRTVEEQLRPAEEYLHGIDGVTSVITQIGGGDVRFLLTYTPNPASSNIATIYCDVDDYRLIDEIQQDVQRRLDELVPAAICNVRKFLLGPGEGGKIQLRISGKDRTTLRSLANEAMDIMYQDGGLKAIRSAWMNKVKVVRPVMAEAQARQLGISRPQLTDALESAFEGKQTAVYREGEELLPIIARAPEAERITVDNIQDLQIWSPAANRMIPMRQILRGFETVTEDPVVERFNRSTMIKIHCDPKTELTSEVLARIKPKIEMALGVDLGVYFGNSYASDEEMYAGFNDQTIKIRDQDQIPLKGMPGYFMAWGGETEDSSRAQASLAASIPIFFGIMVLIVIFLFNAFRQPLIIWLTVPLSLIGVTVGLLVFKQPFGFMALLGLMSLSGMLIKNAIVLIDEIDTQIGTGRDPYESVVASGVSRMRPVTMAALTTILGMIPLLTDAFFISMAVTIMFGLGFATLLTLIVVPVLYTIFFRIPNRPT